MAETKKTAKTTAKKVLKPEIEKKLIRKKIAACLWEDDELVGLELADGTKVTFQKVQIK